MIQQNNIIEIISFYIIQMDKIIFIDDGNILYGTGSNSHGQLGNSSNNTKAYTQLATNVEYAKAIKNLTIIKNLC